MIKPIGLYERLGGQKAVERATAIFYVKMLRDETLAPYFEGIALERLQQKMVAFMTQAFGGEYEHTAAELKRVHAPMRLSDGEFNIAMEHLHATLEQMQLDSDLKEEVLAIMASAKSAIVTQSA